MQREGSEYNVWERNITLIAVEKKGLAINQKNVKKYGPITKSTVIFSDFFSVWVCRPSTCASPKARSAAAQDEGTTLDCTH